MKKFFSRLAEVYRTLNNKADSVKDASREKRLRSLSTRSLRMESLEERQLLSATDFQSFSNISVINEQENVVLESPALDLNSIPLEGMTIDPTDATVNVDEVSSTIKITGNMAWTDGKGYNVNLTLTKPDGLDAGVTGGTYTLDGTEHSFTYDDATTNTDKINLVVDSLNAAYKTITIDWDGDETTYVPKDYTIDTTGVKGTDGTAPKFDYGIAVKGETDPTTATATTEGTYDIAYTTGELAWAAGSGDATLTDAVTNKTINGYYLQFEFTAPTGYTNGAAFKVNGISTTATITDNTLYVAVTDPSNLTNLEVSVDWDGEAATYGEVTYKVATTDVTVKQLNYGVTTDAATTEVTAETTVGTYTIKPTGILKYGDITDAIDSTGAAVASGNGYYLDITFTAPADATADATRTYAIDSVTDAPFTNNTIKLALNSDTDFTAAATYATFKIDWDGATAIKYGEVTYTLDLTGVSIPDVKTNAPVTEVTLTVANEFTVKPIGKLSWGDGISVINKTGNYSGYYLTLTYTKLATADTTATYDDNGTPKSLTITEGQAPEFNIAIDSLDAEPGKVTIYWDGEAGLSAPEVYTIDLAAATMPQFSEDITVSVATQGTAPTSSSVAVSEGSYTISVTGRAKWGSIRDALTTYANDAEKTTGYYLEVSVSGPADALYQIGGTTITLTEGKFNLALDSLSDLNATFATLTIDRDGADAAAYEAVSYTLDTSAVTMPQWDYGVTTSSAGDPTVTATTDEGIYTITEIGRVAWGELSGALNYVDGTSQTYGYYLDLTFTAPTGVTGAETKYQIGAGTETVFTGTTFKYILTPEDLGKADFATITIDWDGAEAGVFETVTYKVSTEGAAMPQWDYGVTTSSAGDPTVTATTDEGIYTITEIGRVAWGELSGALNYVDGTSQTYGYYLDLTFTAPTGVTGAETKYQIGAGTETVFTGTTFKYILTPEDLGKADFATITIDWDGAEAGVFEAVSYTLDTSAVTMPQWDYGVTTSSAGDPTVTATTDEGIYTITEIGRVAWGELSGALNYVDGTSQTYGYYLDLTFTAPTGVTGAETKYQIGAGTETVFTGTTFKYILTPEDLGKADFATITIDWDGAEAGVFETVTYKVSTEGITMPQWNYGIDTDIVPITSDPAAPVTTVADATEGQYNVTVVGNLKYGKIDGAVNKTEADFKDKDYASYLTLTFTAPSKEFANPEYKYGTATEGTPFEPNGGGTYTLKIALKDTNDLATSKTVKVDWDGKDSDVFGEVTYVLDLSSAKIPDIFTDAEGTDVIVIDSTDDHVSVFGKLNWKEGVTPLNENESEDSTGYILEITLTPPAYATKDAKYYWGDDATAKPAPISDIMTDDEVKFVLKFNNINELEKGIEGFTKLTLDWDGTGNNKKTYTLFTNNANMPKFSEDITVATTPESTSLETAEGEYQVSFTANSATWGQNVVVANAATAHTGYYVTVTVTKPTEAIGTVEYKLDRVSNDTINAAVTESGEEATFSFKLALDSLEDLKADFAILTIDRDGAATAYKPVSYTLDTSAVTMPKFAGDMNVTVSTRDNDGTTSPVDEGEFAVKGFAEEAKWGEITDAVTGEKYTGYYISITVTKPTELDNKQTPETPYVPVYVFGDGTAIAEGAITKSEDGKSLTFNISLDSIDDLKHNLDDHEDPFITITIDRDGNDAAFEAVSYKVDTSAVTMLHFNHGVKTSAIPVDGEFKVEADPDPNKCGTYNLSNFGKVVWGDLTDAVNYDAGAENSRKYGYYLDLTFTVPGGVTGTEAKYEIGTDSGKITFTYVTVTDADTGTTTTYAPFKYILEPEDLDKAEFATITIDWDGETKVDPEAGEVGSAYGTVTYKVSTVGAIMSKLTGMVEDTDTKKHFESLDEDTNVISDNLEGEGHYLITVSDNLAKLKMDESGQYYIEMKFTAPLESDSANNPTFTVKGVGYGENGEEGRKVLNGEETDTVVIKNADGTYTLRHFITNANSYQDENHIPELIVDWDGPEKDDPEKGKVGNAYEEITYHFDATSVNFSEMGVYTVDENGGIIRYYAKLSDVVSDTAVIPENESSENLTTIKLTQSITDNVDVAAGRFVKIDLNGFTITAGIPDPENPDLDPDTVLTTSAVDGKTGEVIIVDTHTNPEGGPVTLGTLTGNIKNIGNNTMSIGDGSIIIINGNVENGTGTEANPSVMNIGTVEKSTVSILGNVTNTGNNGEGAIMTISGDGDQKVYITGKVQNQGGKLYLEGTTEVKTLNIEKGASLVISEEGVLAYQFTDSSTTPPTDGWVKNPVKGPLCIDGEELKANEGKTLWIQRYSDEAAETTIGTPVAYGINLVDALPKITFNQITFANDPTLVKYNINIDQNVEKMEIVWGDKSATPSETKENAFSAAFIHSYAAGEYNIVLNVTVKKDSKDYTYQYSLGKHTVAAAEPSEQASAPIVTVEVPVAAAPVARIAAEAAPVITENVPVGNALLNEISIDNSSKKSPLTEVVMADPVMESNTGIYDRAVETVFEDDSNNLILSVIENDKSDKSDNQKSSFELDDLFADEDFQNEIELNF